MKRFIWLLIPLVMVFFISIKAKQTDIQDDDYPQAPEFTLTDLSGNEISLSDYSGKVIFLNFWATWCPPCRAEIPGFVKAYEQYKNKGMVIIGVSLDRKDFSSVQKFIEEYKINYPIAMATLEIVNNYRPGRFIPTTFIIDQNGKIRHKHIGFMDKETLKNYFIELEEEQ